jgi:hypothetical protein
VCQPYKGHGGQPWQDIIQYTSAYSEIANHRRLSLWCRSLPGDFKFPSCRRLYFGHESCIYDLRSLVSVQLESLHQRAPGQMTIHIDTFPTRTCNASAFSTQITRQDRFTNYQKTVQHCPRAPGPVYDYMTARQKCHAKSYTLHCQPASVPEACTHNT